MDLRDFISWIGLHVRLSSSRPEEILPQENRPIENVPDTQNRPNEPPIDPEYISKCAACAANLLNDREKEILYCRWGSGLSLKDIADRMGYKSSSGPDYFLKNAEHKLRRFLRDKPGLEPDDLDDAAFAIFRKNLFAILKESLSQP
ncbi:MAG: sigma-70 family RNA polymerase sigma factor [bacterium]|nr:sigma-70 family RNA polymerase sigma factor [bacterium]